MSQDLFQRRVPFLDLLGVVPRLAENGRAEFELTVETKHLRTFGILHGGVTATLLDAAMGFAAVTRAPEGHHVVTAQLGLHFTRPAKEGERLIAAGEVVHCGSRTAVTRGEVRGADGALVATGTATFLYLPAPASPAPAVRSLSRDEVRSLDERAVRDFAMPGALLMENAGRGAAARLIELGVRGRVAICAGRGNNGGDGFVIARHLENRGVDVRVLLFGDPTRLSGDAATNWKILEAARTPLRVFADAPAPAELDAELAAAEWIVDALLGTGTRGEVREPFGAVIDRINASGRRVFAVDLPSGLDCDTGRPLGACVRAEHTATFVARKKGFDVPGSEEWTGAVHVVDIGVPQALVRQSASAGPGTL